MIAFERIRLLCIERGISINKLEEDLELGRNSMYQWKKFLPKSENLLKVADYFDVSTDFLLGRTDIRKGTAKSTKKEISIEEALDSVTNWRGKKLTSNDREIIKAYIEGLMARKEDE